MKYWNDEGKHQSLHSLYFHTLVPDFGKADTPEGEALRAINKIYYDVYNNGACNIFETEEVYDDDGDHYADEYSISRFYEDFFDEVAYFTRDHAGVDRLKQMIKDLGVDYWHSDLNKTLDGFVDKIIEKIHSTNGPALVQARQLNPKLL